MKRKMIYLLLVFVAAIITTSCSKNQAELLIPQDVIVVFTTNPATIVKKGGDDFSNAFKSLPVNTLFTPGVSSIAQSLISDPTSSGVNLTSDIFCYVSGVKVGLVFELSSESKFKSLVEKLQVEGLIQPMEQNEGITIARVDAQSALYFDGDRALVVGAFEGDLDEAPLAQFKQTDKTSVVGQKGYTKLKSKAKDISFWFKSDAIHLLKRYNRNMAYFDLVQVPAVDYIVTTDFEKGKIVFEGFYFSEDAKVIDQAERSKKILTKASTKFLNNIPQGSFLALNAGVRFDELFNYIREDGQLSQSLQSLPQEAIDIFSKISGTITIAVLSVTHEPHFVVFLETKEGGALARLRESVGPMLRQVSEKTVVIGGDVFITEGDDYLCITSEESIAVNSLTDINPSIKKDEYARVINESNYLNFAAKLPQLPMFEAVPAAQELEHIEVRVSDYDKFEAVIHFKDKRKNSLSKLFEITSSFVK